MFRVLSMVLFFLVIGCNNQKCREALEPAPISLQLERFDQDIFNAESASQIENFLNDHPSFAKLFLDLDEYPNSKILADKLFILMQNPSIDTLFVEAEEAFKGVDEIVDNLEAALGRLKVYFPQTPSPKVQLAFTGFYKDLVITNEQIIIGTDFFIGKDASYLPQQIPDYILNRYDTEHLPTNIIQFISSQFIQQTNGETMLSEMIDYGKSYYFLSKLLPCTSENILIGYTAEEWENSFENDEVIWANFVENKLLYETNHQTKQKFLGERPNVYEIGNKCPGRIGRWLGWQIVKAYAENADISMKEILAEKDANEIFRLSRYKPSGS